MFPVMTIGIRKQLQIFLQAFKERCHGCENAHVGHGHWTCRLQAPRHGTNRQTARRVAAPYRMHCVISRKCRCQIEPCQKSICFRNPIGSLDMDSPAISRSSRPSRRHNSRHNSRHRTSRRRRDRTTDRSHRSNSRHNPSPRHWIPCIRPYRCQCSRPSRSP